MRVTLWQHLSSARPACKVCFCSEVQEQAIPKEREKMALISLHTAVGTVSDSGCLSQGRPTESRRYRRRQLRGRRARLRHARPHQAGRLRRDQKRHDKVRQTRQRHRARQKGRRRAAGQREQSRVRPRPGPADGRRQGGALPGDHGPDRPGGRVHHPRAVLGFLPADGQDRPGRPGLRRGQGRELLQTHSRPDWLPRSQRRPRC